jgi:PAS domain S-box-containing protein
MIQVPGITACLLESGASNKSAVDPSAVFSFLTTVISYRGQREDIRGNFFAIQFVNPLKRSKKRGHSMWWPMNPNMLRTWPYLGLVLVLFCFLPGSAGEAPSKPVRRVLIFNEVGTAYPGINLMDQGIRSALRTSSYKLEVYREYMDTLLFPDPADQQRFRDFYIRKYQNRKPDVIITVGPSPLKFMLETHHSAFPGVPIAFCLPTWGPGTPVLDSDFTGVENAFAPFETIEAALRLQPSTKHIVVVGGAGAHDKLLEERVRDVLKPYERNFDLSYLTNLTMPDLVETLKRLPNHTIVLFTGMGQDAAGTKFISGEEAVEKVVAAANAPVFGLNDIDLGHGEVGGKVSYIREQGRIAGDIALRMLKGERPQDIPTVRDITAYMFDSRALKRWGFKESDLPPGSILLNRKATFWESYKWYVISSVSLFLLEALLISGLLWQRTRRRHAENVVRESERRFRLVANTAPVMIWMSGTDKLCTYVNQAWLDLTGRNFAAEMGSGWLESIHPEDAKACFDIYSQAFNRREPFTMQYRVRRHDGDYRWVLDRGVPRFNDDHSFAGYTGSCVDITDRKLAEEALSGVSRRLIQSQEQERSRIGRELHDDINQQLALLAVELDRSDQSGSIRDFRSRFQESKKRVMEIARAVEALSHHLHSSKLEYLGLVTAAKSFCKEFSETHNVTIDFTQDGVPRNLPEEVALSLFRVLQEALQNAVKYSGTDRFEVDLCGTSADIRLRIRDWGRGFSVDDAMTTNGLGLVSMRERVKLVNGEIVIQSKPMAGAEITVHIPVPIADRTSEVISGAA